MNNYPKLVELSTYEPFVGTFNQPLILVNTIKEETLFLDAVNFDKFTMTIDEYVSHFHERHNYFEYTGQSSCRLQTHGLILREMGVSSIITALIESDILDVFQWVSMLTGDPLISIKITHVPMLG